MKSGIYVYRNNINGKSYVGQSLDIQRRINQHNHKLSIEGDNCTVLQRAVNKYGIENFYVGVLEYCILDELDAKEIHWIKKLNSLHPNGYNMQSGGSFGLHSEESKISMMISKLGKQKSKRTSKYFGVSRRIYKGKYKYWRATIQYNGNHIFLGQFKYEEDAARKYDEFVLSNRLQVPINFPQDVV